MVWRKSLKDRASSEDKDNFLVVVFPLFWIFLCFSSESLCPCFLVIV